MTTQTQRDAVADIVRNILDQKFGDSLTFDQIIVKDAVDIVDGMEYLRIRIVFEGDGELMDVGWRIGMRRRTRKEMAELDMYEFPSISFVEKSDWEALLAGEYYESS